MARILVTGGAGYIGSHCCKALAKAGFEPIVFDDLSTGHRSAVRWGPLIEGDIKDNEKLRKTLQEEQPEAVLHFASLALVGESTRRPELYWSTNVGGTLSLLSAMLEAGVSRIVFSSTCAIYGEPERVPIVEDMPKAPVNPYGATKLACEQMMDHFDLAHGIRSARLRYFNAAGADPDGEIGEWHEPETHLIPLVLDAALGRRPAVAIFGTDFPTPDRTAQRDYIHVADLARAHVAALRHLIAGGSSCAINLGTGVPASVRDVIRTVESVTGRTVPVKEEGRRAGDPATLIADPSKAQALLNWRAEADIETMIADAWEWHRRLNT